MRTSSDCRGFALLEVLFAILIFGVAIVAIVQAVNATGETSAAALRTQSVASRLDSLLLEASRNPPQELQQTTAPLENVVRESDVEYKVSFRPAELKNADGIALNGLFTIKVVARWTEGLRQREMTGDTLLYPPLYAPPRIQ